MTNQSGPARAAGPTAGETCRRRLGSPQTRATVGRYEYRDGLETVPGDPTLAAVKRKRIAERLVGPFDFTHVTRSFDGGWLAWDRPAWNVTAFGTRPTQGGFEVSANRELDLTLAGAAVTLKRLPSFPAAGRGTPA